VVKSAPVPPELRIGFQADDPVLCRTDSPEKSRSFVAAGYVRSPPAALVTALREGALLGPGIRRPQAGDTGLGVGDLCARWKLLFEGLQSHIRRVELSRAARARSARQAQPAVGDSDELIIPRPARQGAARNVQLLCCLVVRETKLGGAGFVEILVVKQRVREPNEDSAALRMGFFQLAEDPLGL